MLIAEVAEDVLTAFFSGNIFISFFTSNLLQYLWGLVNTLQIIVLMNLFNIEIPENAGLLMTTILKMCALEFIPKEKALEFFNFRETEPFNMRADSNGEESSKYDDAGYDSSNFFELIGPILIMIVLFILYATFKTIT